MHFKYLKQIPGNHGDWRIDFLSAFSVFPYQGINLSGFSKKGLHPLPAPLHMELSFCSTGGRVSVWDGSQADSFKTRLMSL